MCPEQMGRKKIRPEFCNVCGRFVVGDRPPTPRKSFRGHWDARCESEWRRAFLMFSLGDFTPSY